MASVQSNDIDSDMESDSTSDNGSTFKESDGTNDFIVKSESTAIFRLRCLVFLVMFLAAVGLSLTVFFITAPIVIACMVALAFAITAGVFLLYSHRVERRQRIILQQAVQSTAIVASLFPEAVRDRMVGGNNQNGLTSGKDRLKAFLADGDDGGCENDDTPIADLFPHSTVFFADIAGFTSWSSCREPTQVFILLQTIYQAFDLIAKDRKVFKVETIGDSYVAVCGLPKADENHFISMSRFATDCLAKFTALTNKLEEKLGPGTAALGLRVGLHR
jgi:class 3 adenylate cyclase